MSKEQQAIPKVIGPYRILRKLGKGGMGMVYHAQHKETNQHVAVKTVRLTQPKMLNQIRREIHTLSRLRHPGIVSILDHGVEDGNPWYSMELIRGKTLREHCWEHVSREVNQEPNTPRMEFHQESTFIKNKEYPKPHSSGVERTVLESSSEEANAEPLWWTQTLADHGLWEEHTREAVSPEPHDFQNADPNEPIESSKEKGRTLPPTFSSITAEHLHRVMEIVCRICGPLSYLHGEGIIHCDLKPSNILVREDGWPVIIDFGLLRQFSGKVSRETLGTVQLGLGTLPYMAPEQFDGSLLDARTDLYAMGCLIYEMLSGRPPFVGSPAAVVGMHLEKAPTPLSHRTQGIPPALDLLVTRLLAKPPQERIGYSDSIRYTLQTLLNMMQRGGPQRWPGQSQEKPRLYLYRPGLAGREKTFLALQESLLQLRDGKGKIALLGGESGVGKTRIALELASVAIHQDIKVITGECSDRSKNPLEAFQPFFQAVADRSLVHGQGEARRLLGKEGWALLPFAPRLQELKEEDNLPTLVDTSPDKFNQVISRALVHMLQSYTKEQPLLLVLDDLQWADPYTLDSLFYLAEMESFSNLLLIGTYRSEEASPAIQDLSQYTHISHILLERLTKQAVGSMIRDMLALSEVPDGLSQHLTHHSEGNPFFVAEYLRAAVESGLLWRSPQGHWQVGSHAASMSLSPRESQLPLPNSLRGLVTRRLSDLSNVAYEVMAAAAVLGREVSIPILQSMTGASQEQLWEALEELHRRELLIANSQDMLRFAHAKLREVALDTISNEKLTQYHHSAAQTIERFHNHNLGPYLADLSNHWKNAGNKEKATKYTRLAADQARQKHLNQEAIQHYKEYLQLVAEQSEECLTVRLNLGDLLKLVGNIKDAEKVYKQAVALSQRMQNRKLEGISVSKLGLLHWHTGRLDTGGELFVKSLSIHQEIGNRKMEGMTTGYLAGLNYYRGDFRLAKEQYQQALSLHREVSNRTAEGRDLSNLGNIFFELNELDKALEHYLSALDFLDEPGSKRYRNLVLNNIAHVHHYQGNTDLSEHFYTQMLSDAQSRGDLSSEGVALGNMAHLYRDLGRIEEARDYFHEALNIHRQIGNRMFEGVHRIHQLTLDRLLNQPLTSLKATLMSAEALLRNPQETFYITLAFCEAGHIKLANLQSAEHELNKAIEKAATAGVNPESPTEVGVALRRLQNAQIAYLDDRFLYCGQRIEDIPEGLRHRLYSDGYLS